MRYSPKISAIIKANRPKEVVISSDQIQEGLKAAGIPFSVNEGGYIYLLAPPGKRVIISSYNDYDPKLLVTWKPNIPDNRATQLVFSPDIAFHDMESEQAEKIASALLEYAGFEPVVVELPEKVVCLQDIRLAGGFAWRCVLDSEARALLFQLRCAMEDY